LDGIAVGPEDDRLGGVGGPWWRRTEPTAATRACQLSHLGVWVGAEVQPPVDTVFGGATGGLRTCFQNSKQNRL